MAKKIIWYFQLLLIILICISGLYGVIEDSMFVLAAMFLFGILGGVQLITCIVLFCMKIYKEEALGSPMKRYFLAVLFFGIGLWFSQPIEKFILKILYPWVKDTHLMRSYDDTIVLTLSFLYLIPLSLYFLYKVYGKPKSML